MERAEQDALIETAIATAMLDEGMVDETDLITGFVVVASYQRESGMTRLAYWLPQHQAPHSSIGMLELIQEHVRDDYMVD